MKPWLLPAILLIAMASKVYCQTLTLQTFSSGGTSTSPLLSTFGQAISSSPVAGTTGNLESGFAPSLTAFSSNFPPAIVYSAETAAIQEGDKLKVTATDADGISKVTLFTRPITSNTFDSVAMTTTANNGYEATIQRAHYDELGVEYFFKALDKTGKRSTKLDGNGKYFHRYKSAEGAAVPPTIFNIGTKSSDYRIITIPYALQVPGIGSQLNELGEQSNAVYRLATYAGNSKWNEFPSSSLTVFERGKGYWFLTTKSDATLFLEGESTPENYRSNLFQMTLQPEWNQIGNPYPIAINWSDVLDYNDNPNVGNLKVFSGGYADGNELKPYEGGFVRNTGSAPITIAIPFKGQTTSSGRVKRNAFATELDAQNWMLRLRVTNKELFNGVSAIGMHVDASEGWDLFDDVYPPRFSNFLELEFDQSEESKRSLSKHIVPTQQSFVWSFSLATTDAMETQLEWDNEHFGNNNVELLLFDETKLQLVDMRTTSSHPINKVGKYTIYYGARIRETIRPAHAGLGNPYPNPAFVHGDVKIPFAVPEGFHHNVQLEILDGQGREVRSVLSDWREPGFYELAWDASDVSGHRCSPGLYIVRLTLLSNGHQKQFYSRIILK